MKTAKSRRRIDIGQGMMTDLKKWKLEARPGELVFANEAGQPIDHGNMVYRQFRSALRKADLDIIRFHDLMHTYASLKLSQGADIFYVSRQLVL